MDRRPSWRRPCPRPFCGLTPGGHMSAVTKPELGQEIADFLAA